MMAIVPRRLGAFKQPVVFLATLLAGCSLLAPPDSELLGGHLDGGSAGIDGGGTTGGSGGMGGAGGTASGATAGISQGGTAGIGSTGSTGGVPSSGAGGGGGIPGEPETKDLTLWLRADMNVNSMSNRVTAWASRIPNDGAPEYSVFQDVPAMAPGYGTMLLGGKILPSFDGVDDGLYGQEDHEFTGDRGASFFAVLLPSTTVGTGEVFAIEGAAGRHLGLWQTESGVAFGTSDNSFPPLLTQGVFSVGTAVLVAVVLNQPEEGPPTVSIYVNGRPATSGAGALWQDTTAFGFRMGAHGAQTGFNGGVAEVLIYKAPLGAAARFGTEAYLRQRWSCCG